MNASDTTEATGEEFCRLFLSLSRQRQFDAIKAVRAEGGALHERANMMARIVERDETKGKAQ